MSAVAPKFGWLRTVASVLVVVGWITVVGGIVLAVKAFSANNSLDQVLAVPAFSVILSGLLLVLVSGAVTVLIDIEENTRRVQHATEAAVGIESVPPPSGLEM